MIQLFFEENPGALIELIKVVVFLNLEQKPIISSRGRESVMGPGEGTFTWSNGVKALCELILRAKFDNESPGDNNTNLATISGNKGSSASSLDYAIAKQPRWIMDMFGRDKNGTSKIRRLIKRHNPEGKRLGPIILSWNYSACPKEEIEIYLNNTLLTSPNNLQSLFSKTELKESPGLQTNNHNGRAGLNHVSPLNTFNLGDTIVKGISGQTVSLDEIESHLQSQNVMASSSSFRNEIENLVKNGILKKKGDKIAISHELKNTQDQLQYRLKQLDSLSFSALGNSSPIFQNGQGHSNTDTSSRSDFEWSIQFNNLCEMDSFLDMLMPELASLLEKSQRILWHIRTPWLPLLRPGNVCRDITNVTALRSAKLITTGDFPTNKWVIDFYSKLGIDAWVTPEPILQSDFWINGDIVVGYGVPKEIQEEAVAFLQRYQDVADFDTISFYKDILQKPCKPYIHVALAPGLAQQLYARALAKKPRMNSRRIRN